jgi:uncharacterized protein (DUF849 family)
LRKSPRFDGRTGLEDNIKFDRERLARKAVPNWSPRVRDLCGKYGRHAATPKAAREILCLRPA